MCVCVDDDHTVSSDTFPSLAHLFLWWRIVFFGVGLVNKKKYIYKNLGKMDTRCGLDDDDTQPSEIFFFFYFFTKKRFSTIVARALTKIELFPPPPLTLF